MIPPVGNTITNLLCRLLNDFLKSDVNDNIKSAFYLISFLLNYGSITDGNFL